MFRIITLTIVFCWGVSSANAQFVRPETTYSIGYQYSNFGNSFSAAQIQMNGMNQNAYENKRFSNDRNAYGLVLRIMLSNSKGLTSEFALGNKKVLSQMSYYDSLNASVIDIKTKQRMRYLSYGLHYATGRFTIGASVDLGIFASLIKLKGTGSETDGSWQPWFNTPKLLGSGITGKTPVVGWSLSAGCMITKYTEVRIYKQFTAFNMGAELSNRYFSMANWGVEFAITFGS